MPDWTLKTDDELKQAHANALAKIDDPKWGAKARERLEEIDAEMQRRADEISGMDPDEAERIRSEVDGLDLSQRVAKAFTDRPPSRAERLAIEAVYWHPGATSSELADAVGWPGESTWHLVFGTMCQRREPWLPPPPASQDRPGQAFYSGVLCHLQRPQNRFRLKPEAQAGFEDLGLLGRVA